MGCFRSRNVESWAHTLFKQGNNAGTTNKLHFISHRSLVLRTRTHTYSRWETTTNSVHRSGSALPSLPTCNPGNTSLQPFFRVSTDTRWSHSEPANISSTIVSCPCFSSTCGVVCVRSMESGAKGGNDQRLELYRTICCRRRHRNLYGESSSKHLNGSSRNVVSFWP